MGRKIVQTTASIVEIVLMILLGLTVYQYFLYRDYQEREVVSFSHLSVCTKNGESIGQTSSPDGPPLFLVPKEINRVYICGTVETPFQVILGINLYKINGREENIDHHTIQSKWLQSGPFVFDVISTEKLDAGEYRAKLYIGRIHKEDVRFFVER